MKCLKAKKTSANEMAEPFLLTTCVFSLSNVRSSAIEQMRKYLYQLCASVDTQAECQPWPGIFIRLRETEQAFQGNAVSRFQLSLRL